MAPLPADIYLPAPTTGTVATIAGGGGITIGGTAANPTVALSTPVARASLPNTVTYLDTAQTFTAAQIGPFRDRGGAVFNVKAYGALGGADDSATIALAVAAGVAGGGPFTLVFPPISGGVYKGIAVVPSDCTVDLQGNTLMLPNAKNTDVIQSTHFLSLTGTNQNGAGALTAGDNRIDIRNGTIDGNSASNTSGFGIRIWGHSYRFQNVIVQNCAQDGIWTEFAHDIAEFVPTNRIEGHATSVYCIGNGGNGWSDFGPHDSVRIGYEAFGNNTGWGTLLGCQAIGTATLTLATPTGGTFILYYNGNATTALAFNATAAAVQTALRLLPGGAGIVCAGGPVATSPVTITPVGAALFDINPVGLTAGVGGINVGLTLGTLVNNGSSHGSMWNLFENANGTYVGGGASIDVYGINTAGSQAGTGTCLFLAPGSGSCHVSGIIGGGTVGMVAGGSNHRLDLQLASNTTDGLQEAALGLSVIDIRGGIPSSGNGIKWGKQLQSSGGNTYRGRVTVGGGGTLTTGSNFSVDYLEIGQAGVTETMQLPGSGFTGAGWTPQFPASNAVLITANTGAFTNGVGFWNHAQPGAQPAAPVTLADVIAIIRGCGLSA